MYPRPHSIAWWASYSVLAVLVWLAVGFVLYWIDPVLWEFWIAW